MRIPLFAILVALPLLAISQPTTFDEKDGVFDFQFDKALVKERAIEELGKSGDSNDIRISTFTFSSVNGKNCRGKPARYIIALAISTKYSPSYIIFDVSNSRKWPILTEGSGGQTLSSLRGQLLSPDFTSDIRCVGD